jgi:hypothetical protein
MALVTLSYLLRSVASAPQFATPLRVVAGLVALACLVVCGVILVRWIHARGRDEG